MLLAVTFFLLLATTMARKKSKTVEKAKVKLKCNLVALNSKGIALKGK